MPACSSVAAGSSAALLVEVGHDMSVVRRCPVVQEVVLALEIDYFDVLADGRGEEIGERTASGAAVVTRFRTMRCPPAGRGIQGFRPPSEVVETWTGCCIPWTSGWTADEFDERKLP